MENEFLQVGFLNKAKSLKGALKVTFEAFFLAYLEENGLPPHFYVQAEGKFLPYFVESLHPEGANTIRFEGVGTRSQAEAIQHKPIFIEARLVEEADIVPEDFDDNEWKHLIGYSVLNASQNLSPSGKVTDVVSLPGHDLLQLSQGGREFLVPIHEELIVGMDEESRQLKLHIAEGLDEL